MIHLLAPKEAINQSNGRGPWRFYRTSGVKKPNKCNFNKSLRYLYHNQLQQTEKDGGWQGHLVRSKDSWLSLRPQGRKPDGLPLGKTNSMKAGSKKNIIGWRQAMTPHIQFHLNVHLVKSRVRLVRYNHVSSACESLFFYNSILCKVLSKHSILQMHFVEQRKPIHLLQIIFKNSIIHSPSDKMNLPATLLEMH